MASQDFTTGVGTKGPWSNSPNVLLYHHKFKAADVTTLGASDVYTLIDIPAESVILQVWGNVRVASATGTVAISDGTVTWSSATAPTSTGPLPLTAVAHVINAAAAAVIITVAAAALAATCEIDVYALVADNNTEFTAP